MNFVSEMTDCSYEVTNFYVYLQTIVNLEKGLINPKDLGIKTCIVNWFGR